MFQESSFCIILSGAWEMESLFPFYLGERLFLLLISLFHRYGVKTHHSPCFHKWVNELVKEHMYHIMGACCDKWLYTVINGWLGTLILEIYMFYFLVISESCVSSSGSFLNILVHRPLCMRTCKGHSDLVWSKVSSQ